MTDGQGRTVDFKNTVIVMTSSRNRKNPLAKLILEGRFAAKDTIKVDCVGGVMKFGKD